MQLDDEFRRFLRSLSVEIGLRLLDEANQYQADAVFKAQQNLNRAALPQAHSNAKVHAFEHRVRLTIERFIGAVQNCRDVLLEVIGRC
jgi:hypothetical protein